MPRKPKQQPATAYSYRRVIALVQVLAMKDNVNRRHALVRLGKSWGYKIPWDWMYQITQDLLIRELAKHALEHSLKSGDDKK